MVRYLTAEEIWLVHCLVLVQELQEAGLGVEQMWVALDEDSRRMRVDLLESAVFSIRQPYYRSFWHRTAALFRSLVKNHAFFDGNKRTALIATELFLELNGYRLTANRQQKTRFTIGVALGHRLGRIESWLRTHSRPICPREEAARVESRIAVLRRLAKAIGLTRPSLADLADVEENEDREDPSKG